MIAKVFCNVVYSRRRIVRLNECTQQGCEGTEDSRVALVTEFHRDDYVFLTRWLEWEMECLKWFLASTMFQAIYLDI